MKTSFSICRFFGTIGLIVLCLSHAGYAQESDFPSKKAKETISNTFIDATNVSWKKHNKIYYATFTNSGQSWIAFVQNDGTLVASGRRIAFTNLPLVVQENVKPIVKNFEKKFGTLQHGCIYEMVNSGLTEYYIPFENDNHTLALLATGMGTVTVVAKKLKNKLNLTEPKTNVMAKK